MHSYIMQFFSLLLLLFSPGTVSCASYFAFYNLSLPSSATLAPDLLGAGPTMAGGTSVTDGVYLDSGAAWRTHGSVLGLTIRAPANAGSISVLAGLTPAGCEWGEFLSRIAGESGSGPACGVVCADSGQPRGLLWSVSCDGANGKSVSTPRGRLAVFNITYFRNTQGDLSISLQYKDQTSLLTTAGHRFPPSAQLSIRPPIGSLHFVGLLDNSRRRRSLAADAKSTFQIIYSGCAVACPYGCRSDDTQQCRIKCPTGMAVTGSNAGYVTCGDMNQEDPEVWEIVMAVLCPVLAVLIAMAILYFGCLRRRRNEAERKQRMIVPFAERQNLRLESVRLSPECKICYRPQAKLVVMLPCGHAWACSECARKVRICPFDRIPIQECVEVDDKMKEEIWKLAKNGRACWERLGTSTFRTGGNEDAGGKKGELVINMVEEEVEGEEKGARTTRGKGKTGGEGSGKRPRRSSSVGTLGC